MRAIEEIRKEIEHVEYARAVLEERLTVLQAEHDQYREDEYATATITKRLAVFFKGHGLYIVDVKHGERSEELYAIAKQMWRSWAVLVPFIKCLSANKNAAFVYCTTDLTASQKNDLRNLCHELAAKKWIVFANGKAGFQVTPCLTCEQKRFLHGAWAEEVTLYLIDKTLKRFTGTRHLKYRLFWDAKLKRIAPRTDNLSDMQLDLIAQVSDRFYVFETKSGAVHSIDKWVDRTRLFDGAENRFITCTADPNLNPKIFKPFRIFALPTLEEQFTGMLEDDFKEATAANEAIEPPPSEKYVDSERRDR